MLRPQQVEDYAQRCAAAFDELELNILTDMARRIAKANYMTEGAKWQAERAEALGASRKHLADRMEKLMADPDLRHTFSVHAREAYETHFTAQVFASGILNAYDRALGKEAQQ